MLEPYKLATLVIIVFSSQVFNPLDETVEANQQHSVLFVGCVRILIVADELGHEGGPHHVHYYLGHSHQEAKQIFSFEYLKQCQIKVKRVLVVQNCLDALNLVGQVVLRAHATQFLEGHVLIVLAHVNNWLDPVPVQHRPDTGARLEAWSGGEGQSRSFSTTF